MFPAQVDLVLVGVIAYAPEDYGHKHLISVAVQGSDGRGGEFGPSGSRRRPQRPS